MHFVYERFNLAQIIKPTFFHFMRRAVYGQCRTVMSHKNRADRNNVIWFVGAVVIVIL